MQKEKRSGRNDLLSCSRFWNIEENYFLPVGTCSLLSTLSRAFAALKRPFSGKVSLYFYNCSHWKPGGTFILCNIDVFIYLLYFVFPSPPVATVEYVRTWGRGWEGRDWWGSWPKNQRKTESKLLSKMCLAFHDFIWICTCIMKVIYVIGQLWVFTVKVIEVCSIEYKINIST